MVKRVACVWKSSEFCFTLSLRYIFDLVIFGGFLKGGEHEISELSCLFKRERHLDEDVRY